MNLYVYYDVAHDAADEARTRVRAVHADLGRAPTLMRREPGDRATTWMEVHEDVPPDFEARLAAAVARHGLAALTGPRHVERFTALESP